MSIAVVVGYDAIHANVHLLPKGVAVGYTTGSSDIKWTTTDWAAHPGAVRICQDAAASDSTADILDVERGAGTPADCPGWAKRAMTAYDGVSRAGQRSPAIYCSGSSVTPVVNALVNGGVVDGVGLFVANWDLTEATAVDDVKAAAGPFPIIGIQYRNMGSFDADLFSENWLSQVSTNSVKSTKSTRHIATGLSSLADQAGSTDRLEQAIWITALNAPSGFGPAQKSYFGKGNLSAHMPLGMVYWLPPTA